MNFKMNNDILSNQCDSITPIENEKVLTSKETCNVIKFSKAGEILIIGKINGYLCLWRFEGNKLEYKVKLHSAGIYMVEFIDDERQIITGAADNLIKISLIFGKFEVLRIIDNQGHIATGFFCHRKNQLFCNGQNEDEMRIWNFDDYLNNADSILHERNYVMDDEKESIGSPKSAGLLSKKDTFKVQKKKQNQIVKISFKLLNKNARERKKWRIPKIKKDYKKLYEKMLRENKKLKKKMKKFEHEIEKLKKTNENLISEMD